MASWNVVQNLFSRTSFACWRSSIRFLFHAEILHQIFITDAGENLFITVHLDLAFGTEIGEKFAERMLVFGAGFSCCS